MQPREHIADLKDHTFVLSEAYAQNCRKGECRIYVL